MVKMHISITEKLHDKINDYNEKSHVPKSSIIMIALENYFQNKEIMANIVDMAPLIEQLKKMNLELENKKQ